jgi:hypothetical protein
MSYQTKLVSVKTDGVEFIDIRKPELDLFESLKKSGMPHLEFCKSPTEQIIYVWLSVYLTEALMRNCSGKLVRSVIPQCGISPQGYLVHPPEKPGVSYSESIRYKIDFIILFSDSENPDTDVRVAVELDGHDFHSSKQDKKRDEERNRFLLSNLIIPVHFPASVVQQDPKKVVDQIIYIGSKWHRYFKSLNN